MLSPGQSIGLRMIPMVRDLRFLWEEMPQQVLDEQAQKVRESLHAALIGWAQQAGEGADYTDNLPGQCLHPVGHWYEVPNLLRNGVLLRILEERPQLAIPAAAQHRHPGRDGRSRHCSGCIFERGAASPFEVIAREMEDRGGGLARVDGRVRVSRRTRFAREKRIEFSLSLLQLRDLMDRHRAIAGGLRAEPRGSE